MTIIAADATGIATVRATLDRGDSVVVPFPSPLPYAVAARTGAAVNTRKGRPLTQPVGAVVTRRRFGATGMSLDLDTRAFAEWLSAKQLCSIMVPVGDRAAHWSAPATAAGFLALTLAWMPHLKTLFGPEEYLFVSSANPTGDTVATSAAAADAAFAGAAQVIDGDPWRTAEIPSGSATILKLASGMSVEVMRRGINDRSSDSPHAFIQGLKTRWRRHGSSALAPPPLGCMQS